MSKRLDVAIVGLPNAGKSQLLNKLVGEKVSAVSRKRHTTRSNTLGVSHIGRTELIFYDSPGIVSNSEKADVKSSMIADPISAIDSAQVALVVVDSARNHQSHYGEPERRLRRIMQRVFQSGAQLWLVLNKVDLVKDKRRVLVPVVDYVYFMAINEYEKLLRAREGGEEIPFADVDQEGNAAATARQAGTFPKAQEGFQEVTLEADDLEDDERQQVTADGVQIVRRIRDLPNRTGRRSWNRVRSEDAEGSWRYEPPKCTLPEEHWPYIDVFYTDCFRGEGVDEVRTELLEAALPAPWLYDRSQKSDLSFEARVKEIVREKLYRNFHREIPYQTNVEAEILERSSDSVHIRAFLSASTKSQTMILRLSKSGQVLEYVRRTAVDELENIFQLRVKLDLVVSKPKAR